MRFAITFVAEAFPVLALAAWLGPHLGEYGFLALIGAYFVGSVWGHLWHEVRKGLQPRAPST